MRYFAVRKPIEIKGVYTNERKITQLLKDYSKVGLSSRMFKEKEKDEALKWADVKEIADAPQQVVISDKETKVPLNEKAKAFMDILSEYKKQGYYYVEIELINGSVYGLFLANYAKGNINTYGYNDIKDQVKSSLGRWLKVYNYVGKININNEFITFHKLWKNDSYFLKTINVNSIVTITPYLNEFNRNYYDNEIKLEYIQLYESIKQYL